MEKPIPKNINSESIKTGVLFAGLYGIIKFYEYIRTPFDFILVLMIYLMFYRLLCFYSYKIYEYEKIIVNTLKVKDPVWQLIVMPLLIILLICILIFLFEFFLVLLSTV